MMNVPVLASMNATMYSGFIGGWPGKGSPDTARDGTLSETAHASVLTGGTA
jgi:hypothetical protein